MSASSTAAALAGGGSPGRPTIPRPPRPLRCRAAARPPPPVFSGAAALVARARGSVALALGAAPDRPLAQDLPALVHDGARAFLARRLFAGLQLRLIGPLTLRGLRRRGFSVRLVGGFLRHHARLRR